MRGNRIVSVQTTSERGGAEYANVDLLEALAARGHDVVLVTNAPDIAANAGISVRRLELGPKLARRSVPWVAVQAPRSLFRLGLALHREQPVGAVLLHFKKEQLLCSLLPSRLTGRIVWMEWGPVPPPMRHGPARRIYALAARRASRVLAVSDGTRDTVVGAGVPAFKVRVVPNLVDVDAVGFDPVQRAEWRRRWGVGDGTLVVGCISRFQRRKRYDVVVDAMRFVRSSVLLVLAGEGEEEAILRERAAPYGGRVRFLPNVRGQVAAFLSACDLLVFAPSPTEGAPRVIVMAQLVGVPVVATDQEGTRGLLAPQTGTIVSPPHDPQALAATIDSYATDPRRRRLEGEIARAWTRDRHDPERTLRVIEDALGLVGASRL